MIEAKIIDDGGRPWKTLPRCNAVVSEMTRRWRTRCGKDDICERNARYEVNGQPYCKLHAGEVLLSLSLNIPRKELK